MPGEVRIRDSGLITFSRSGVIIPIILQGAKSAKDNGRLTAETLRTQRKNGYLVFSRLRLCDLCVSAVFHTSLRKGVLDHRATEDTERDGKSLCTLNFRDCLTVRSPRSPCPLAL